MLIWLCHVSESGSAPEALNKKAIAIVNRVRDKLTGQYSELSLIRTSIIRNIHIPAWFFWNQFSSSIFYLISPDIHILTVDISNWNKLYHLL